MTSLKSIEAVSLSFTAGVAAGAAFSGSLPWEASSVVLALSIAPALLRKRLPALPEGLSVSLILGSFLLLGIFCSWQASLPFASVSGPVESWARTAGERLKLLIASLPFPSEGTAPLLTALLTGDRTGLSRETVAAFRDSGASHILALSGFHLGIIYVIFDRLTRLVGQSPPARMLRFGAIVLASAFFTLMTGASPSIVRAFLFIVINETLRLTGRPRKATRVLCLALLLQLVLNPAAIRSLGFQLSYLAMTGIFLLYPVLERWYPASSPRDPVRRIWQAAALSISCQVFTAPLAWFRFHTFPRYFLLTNLLALPLTTALMTCALLTLVLWTAGLCPNVLVQMTDALCTLLQRALEIIAGM